MLRYSNMTKIITSIVAVLAVIIGGWWLVKGSAVAPAIPTEEVATGTEAVEATSSAPMQAGEQVEAITLSGNEFSYEPAAISAKVGQSITVTYTNTGKYPHDFVIDELGVKSQVIKSGETDTFSFTPAKTGTFSFYCSLPNHREKGMVGTILVN